MGEFFVRRPIVAMVLSIIIVIVGLLALRSTLISQYPDITPPTIKINTSFVGANAVNLEQGVASNDVNTLLSSDAFAAGVTGMILGPIFEFGINKRRVDVQKAEAEIAVNNFLNTYRTALADVENSLVSIQSYREEYAARQRQVEAARRALMLTKAKYDAGFTSYLEVLIAESYAFDAELLASYTRGQQLTSTVSLYRALGGGW